MNIRKNLVLQILEDLKNRERNATWALNQNKRKIKELAEEQKGLKQMRQEIGKLLSEIQKQVTK